MKVILMMAVSVDGKTALDQNHFPDWTGKEDKKRFVEITKKAGALIMGSKTFDTIGKPLPHRKNIILTRNKKRKSQWNNLVFSDAALPALLHQLEGEGYQEVILAGGSIINTLFAKQHLIDEIIISIAPKVFGSGLSLFTRRIKMELKLKQVERLEDDTIFITYSVIKQAQP